MSRTWKIIAIVLATLIAACILVLFGFTLGVSYSVPRERQEPFFESKYIYVLEGGLYEASL